VRWRAVAPFLLIVSTAPAAQQPDGAVALLLKAAEQARDGRAASQRAALALLLDAAELAQRGKQRAVEGYALMNAAQVYNALGRPDSARPLAQRGLERLPRKGKDASAPIVLLVLGETLQYLGRPDTALICYRRALPGPRTAGTREDARALNDIGSAFHQLGLLDSAGRYLEQARDLRERLQDTLGLGTTLNNLGRLHQTLGRPDSAAALFSAAIPLRRAAHDLAGLGATLNNLGYSLDLLGKPAEALERYREALDALGEAGNVSIAGLTRINMGRAHLALGRMDSARASVLEGLAVKRSVGDSTGVSWGLVDLGRIERAQGNRGAARQALEDARKLLHANGDRGREGGVLYQLGSLAREPGPGGNAIEALARLDTAAAIRGEVGFSASGDEDRISFAEQDVALFEEWTLGWLDRSDLPTEDAALAALAAAERGRSRALLALMREKRGSSAPGADLVREGADLVATLRRANTPALVYLAGRDTLVTWMIPVSGTVTAHRIGAGRAAVSRAVEDFRRALRVESSCEPPPELGATLASAGEALASLLVAEPVRRLLPESGGLLVVPHGPVNLVPFAALPIGLGDQLLGTRLALRYAPSVASAIETGSRPSSLAGEGTDRWRALRPALVAGNPRMPLLLLCGVRLRPRELPAADSSSRWLATRLGADALTADRATERAVRSGAKDARLIHLETHGFAYENEARARESFVTLAADAGSTPASDGDGRLTVGEILDQLPRLQAELVVLGACQTGLGNLRDAEGTIGLQRAFLARGARSTLVSLWDIDDRASGALLREFYLQWLGNGIGKAEALRRAQDSVRSMPGFEHPRFWAAFVLAGGD
jgi:tetratricopeptide (TPR) repeat protein